MHAGVLSTQRGKPLYGKQKRSDISTSKWFSRLAAVGYGTVYAILSFAGFEAAAAFGEETKNPKRAIPVAIMGTGIISSILFAGSHTPKA